MRRLYFFLLSTSLLAAMQLFAQELPEDDGKDLVAKTCAACHGLGNITKNRHTTEEWRNVVLDMDTPLSDEEIDKVASYLGKYFGPDSPRAGQTSPAEKK